MKTNTNTPHITVDLIGIVSQILESVNGKYHSITMEIKNPILFNDYKLNEINGKEFKNRLFCFDNCVDTSSILIDIRWIEVNNLIKSNNTLKEILMLKVLKKGDCITFRAEIPYQFIQGETCMGDLYKGYEFGLPDVSNIKRYTEKGAAQKIRSLIKNLPEPDYFFILPEKYRTNSKRVHDFHVLKICDLNDLYN